MKGDSTIWSLARKKMAGSIATVGNLMNCTYRTSAMPTIMVGETPKNSFGKQASTRKLWLELMGSSVWYGKTIQELSWRICFIQPQKKTMNYKCIFPYLKVNLDHGTLPWRPWGSPIGEAPRIPTNIPPEPKNMEESPPPKKNEKKKCWFRFAIICFQGTHNHRHIFHAASCKWVPPLRWLWPDVHPSWGSSWEVSPVQGNGAPCSEICGGNWQVFQKHDLIGDMNTC